MRQDDSGIADSTALFRSSATRSASDRLFGSVTVIVPPSGFMALTVAVLALVTLGYVAWCVEIPQRTRAVGILMPPDGLLEIVASMSGRVGNIVVSEGQDVKAGDLLLNITSDTQHHADLKLRALRSEITLLAMMHERQQTIDQSRSLSLDGKLASLNKRLAVAKSEFRLQREQVALNRRRLTRRQDLAGKGTIAVDVLDQQRVALLQAKARSAVIKHAILGYEQEIGETIRARADAADEMERRKIRHELEIRRKRNELLEQQQLLSREIRAPESGMVARLNVRAGAPVVSGQTLLKVYRPHQELEAWLYLSSAKAGFLRAGQVVELRLDAYPHQLFGTSSAVVKSVSSIAIVPRDLSVPLTLSGPVFEVRAKLNESTIRAFDASWPLAPGTSFQADLVQRRYRLYEWLLRAIGHGSGEQRA